MANNNKKNTLSTQSASMRRAGYAVLTTLLLPSLALAPPARAASALPEQNPDEIIVTATKRAAPLIDVPVSISAFTSQHIERLDAPTLSTLSGFAGNVYMPPAGEAGRSAITIRGLGAGVNKTAGKAVGVYVDGIYVNADTALDMDMFNVQSVEILKGPQGTLFGRDTIGGAVLVTTTQPRDTFGGQLSASFGNYDQRIVSATADVPLYEDKLVMRLNGRNSHRDGHIFNAYNGTYLGEENHNAFGGTVYLAPDARWNARLNYQYHDKNDRPNAAGESTTNIGSDQIPYTVNQNMGEIQTQMVHRASANVDYDLGDEYTLSAVLGASSVRDHYLQDGDRLPDAITVQRFDNQSHSLSAELRLTSPLYERGHFLLGAYYFSNDTLYAPTFPLMGAAFWQQVLFQPASTLLQDELDGQEIKTDTQTMAAFAHGTYNLSDQLSVFGGLRLTHDRKIVDYHEFGEMFTFFGLPELRHKTKSKNTPLSWTLGTQYKASETINTYAKISRGYRSISVKDDFVSQADIDGDSNGGAQFFTKPEYVTNYELGAKGAWLDGRARVNASAFYMDYTDIQVSISDDEFAFLRSLTNAAKAHVKGFEADASLTPLPGLLITASAGYLKTNYDEFLPSPGDDRSGTGFGSAPQWTFGAALDYQQAVTSGSFDWHVDYTQFTAPDDFVFETLAFVGDYGLTNGSLSYSPDHENWRVKVWLKNAFDVKKPKTNFHWGAGLGPLLDNITAQYERPRSYGLTLDYRFGG